MDLSAQLVPGSFEDALNWLVDNELDVSVFDGHYANDATGASAWPPAMLLKVVLYCYSRGIVSSRAMARACDQNVVVMALSGDSQPHFTTLAAFVARCAEPIAHLFTEVVAICDAQWLIGRAMFAIDGVKLPSNASKS